MLIVHVSNNSFAFGTATTPITDSTCVALVSCLFLMDHFSLWKAFLYKRFHHTLVEEELKKNPSITPHKSNPCSTANRHVWATRCGFGSCLMSKTKTFESWGDKDQIRLFCSFYHKESFICCKNGLDSISWSSQAPRALLAKSHLRLTLWLQA